MPFKLLEEPKVKYFVRSVRINRPLAVSQHNLIDITRLTELCHACRDIHMGSVLIGFFLVHVVVKSGTTFNLNIC